MMLVAITVLVLAVAAVVAESERVINAVDRAASEIHQHIAELKERL